jgi:hypothetical protein
MSNDMRGSAIGSHTLFCDETPNPKKRALHDISRSARGMRSTTFAAEVDSSNGRMMRFGTDRQHAIEIGDVIAR